MIPRGKLDIGYKDLIRGLWYCLSSQPARVNASVSEGADFLCLSVRTGFDLVLSALNLPTGAEILVTNVNIPGMFDIISAHKLKPVGLAVDRATLGLSAAQIREAITTETRAILITHLFGAIMDIDEIVSVARAKELLVIEDCAQAYAGNFYAGHDYSDVVMFSFGLIKTHTAVKGAVIKVRRPALLQQMVRLHSQYPVASRKEYAVRLIKAFLMKILVSRFWFTILYKLVTATGRDIDQVLGGLTRGFPGSNFLDQIRYQPCLPNLKLLWYRMHRFNDPEITLRVALAKEILVGVPDKYKVGTLNSRHTHWVMPVATNEPDKLIKLLRQHGFDATQKASSLIILRPEVRLTLSSGMRMASQQDISEWDQSLNLEHLVYLPAYTPMSKKKRAELNRLLQTFYAVRT